MFSGQIVIDFVYINCTHAEINLQLILFTCYTLTNVALIRGELIAVGY